MQIKLIEIFAGDYVSKDNFQQKLVAGNLFFNIIIKFEYGSE